MPSKLPNWKLHQIRIALEAEMPVAEIATKAQISKKAVYTFRTNLELFNELYPPQSIMKMGRPRLLTAAQELVSV